MSKHLAELCTLLIQKTFGELPARIVSTLFEHGRLPILPLSHHSNLPFRYVNHGLAILLQQRLLCFHTTHDGQTSYEVNVQTIYDIARYGKFAQLAEDIFGQDAAGLVSLLEQYGYASAAEVVEWTNGTTPAESASGTEPYVNGTAMVNGVNKKVGDSHGHASTVKKRMEACGQLFNSRHIVQVAEVDSMSPADFQVMVEEFVTTRLFNGEVKGKKNVAKFRLDVMKEKASMLDANAATVRQLEEAAKRAKLDIDNANNSRDRTEPAMVNGDRKHKNQAEEMTSRRPTKKRKFDGDEPNAVVTGGTPSEDPIQRAEQQVTAFRINRDKFAVSQRTQRLVDFAARCLGNLTAQVYSALLRRLEHNIPRCHDEYAEALKTAKRQDAESEDIGYDSDGEDNPSATSADVEKGLDASLDLQTIFMSDKQPKVKIETSQENGISSDEDMHPPKSETSKENSSSFLKRQKRVHAVDQHLRLLAEHYPHFCIRASGRGQGCYEVNFRELTRSLIQFELEAIITARFGQTAARILRILYSKGKLDEKQIGSIGLLRQRDLRALLTMMQEAGFVDIQEIPRDNARQPSRTIYLWFYDQDRCRKLVLNDTYKAMSRLLQRTNVEQQKVQSVIDKAERSDVKGQEDKYLSEAEQLALANWHKTEEKLMVQLSRQDDLVALLRDY